MVLGFLDAKMYVDVFFLKKIIWIRNKNYNNTTILSTEQNFRKREFLEMVHIKNTITINDRSDIQYLN